MENNKKIEMYVMNHIKLFMLITALFLTIEASSQPAVLPANVDVSAIGTATYSIPIEVVPGTKGLQPNLSIVYNSMSGLGVVGQKWGLQGISSITRVPQTKYFDRNVLPVSYDTSDRFALDGNRMVLFSGSSYQCNNAVYCYEIEDFSRIKKVDSSNSCYFIQTLSDGNKIEYGRGAQSQLILNNNECLSWMINKVSDANGNYMKYCYQQGNGEIWIDHIDYTILSDGTPSYAKVCFEYETMTNPNDGFVSGQQVRQSKRLKNIVIMYQNTQVRKYSLFYNTSLQYDRLTSIVLSDSDNEILSTTTISWHSPSAMATDSLFVNFEGYYTVSGNFNDDKLYDIIAVKENTRDVCFLKGSLNGPGSIQSLNHPLPYGSSFETMTAGDIDNDGIDELIYKSSTGYWNSLKVSNNTVTETELFATITDNVSLGDFDGDGVVEPIALSSNNQLYSWEFDGMANPSTTFQTNYYTYCVGDFDGDGKTDLFLLYSSNAHIYSYNTRTCQWEQQETYTFSNETQYCLSGDFNGDGLSDILFLPLNGSLWKLAIRKGRNSWTLNSIAELDSSHVTSNSFVPKYQPIICDINGDGKSDILQPQSNNTFKYLLSKGCFDNNYQTYSTGTIPKISGQSSEPSRYCIGDFDGNGIADILFNSSAPGSLSGSIKYFYKGSFPGNYVSQISDASGKNIKLEYSTISLMPNRYYGTGMNWMQFPLVKNLIISNGLGGFDTTYFYYGNAKYDADKHQFIGFAQFCMRKNNKVSETFFSRVPKGSNSSFALLMPDSVVNFITSSSINTNINFYWGITSLFIQLPDDILFSKTVNINDSKYRTNVSGNISFLPYVSTSTDYDYLKNTKTINQTTLNSTNWRMSQKKTRFGYISGSLDEPSRQYVNYSYVTYTLQNGVSVVKPKQIITRQYNNISSSNPRRDTVTYTYSTNGYPLTKKHSDNGGLSMTETFTYNNHGHMTSVTTTHKGVSASRSQTYAYDPTYRFVNSTTDHAGNVIQKTYNPATGLCLSETDINNLVTQYEYDGLGRLTLTTYPDATTRSISYTDASGGLANACCYTTVIESGKPETRVYYDCLGRRIHTYVAGQGYMDMVYNKLGQLLKQTIIPNSSASLTASSKKWEFFRYDSFGRIIKDSSYYHKNIYSYRNNNTDYRYHETVEDKLGAESTKYYDAEGRVVEVQDDGGSITYAYDRTVLNSRICDRMQITTGGKTTAIITDSRGNRIRLTDPDAGVTTCTYDVWGNLLTQTDGKGDLTTMTYDNQGRVISKTYFMDYYDGYSYSYGTSAPTKGKVTQINHNSTPYQTLSYDALGRVASSTKYIDGNTYTHQYTYNSNGQLFTTQYPSGYVLRYEYDSDGRLKYLKDNATNTAIYTVDSRNTLSQPKRCWFGNETGVDYTYNAWGMPTQIMYGYREVQFQFRDTIDHAEDDDADNNDADTTANRDDPVVPGIIFYVGDQYSVLQYTYNNNGYITRKKEYKTGQQEDFYYDVLGRLTSVSVNNGTQSYNYMYEDNGNIKRNGKVGSSDYLYDSAKPHAVVQVIDENSVLPTTQCDVTYNSRNRPATISENGWSMELTYGSDLQREKSVLKQGNTTKGTTYFISKDCEYEIKPTFSRYIDYIHADGRIVALHVHNVTANADSLYYVQTDQLGSWDRIVATNRAVVQSSHFDPWGNRMSASNWTSVQDGSNFQFRRGFTGHEHYDRFGIINTNARLYDPVIGRFFSPDPQVQSPFSTQGYNRYSYCGNNPVMYTDPDGELFGIDSWILGFIHGFFSTGSNRWGTALSTANRLAGNDLKIWGGLFVTDPNKSFLGRVWEFKSRFNWQLPQTLIGLGYSQFCNTFEGLGIGDGIRSIDYLYGATMVSHNSNIGGAITLGSYINGGPDLMADPNNSTFQHEYGHYIQSQGMGIAYLSRVGLPSILSSHNHNYHPVEIDANRRAFMYFNKHVGRPYSNSDDWSNKKNDYFKWDLGNNPLNQDGSIYYSSDFSYLNAQWYDYLLILRGGLWGALIDGLCLSIYYNGSY